MPRAAMASQAVLLPSYAEARGNGGIRGSRTGDIVAAASAINLHHMSESPDIASEKAAEHFGWMAMFAPMDLPASSALTQARLGWQPTAPTLIADLA